MVLTMKNLYFLLLVFLFSAGLSSESFAQNALLRYGERQYDMLNYQEAAEVYIKAFERKPTYTSAQMAAKSFENMREYQNSYDWWRITSDFEEATMEDKRSFAQAAQRVGNVDEYYQIKSELGLSDKADMEAIKRLSSKNSATLTSIDSLNSRFTDFGMAVDNQGNKYISSDRGIQETGKASRGSLIRIDGRNRFKRDVYGWTGRDFLSIYRLGEDNEMTEVDSPVPNTFHFSDPFFMKEKPVVFYTVTREVKKVKKKEFNIYPEIYFSQINEAGEFTDYRPFPFNSFMEHSMITPFVDEEAKRIYFASDMVGGLGGHDLYYVTYDDDFKFGEPVNLGPEVNSEGHERNPYRIENRFYFSSDGHTGLGGLDVYKASIDNGQITGVSNMGAPYNSPQDDFAFTPMEKGKAVLSSDRIGGKGLDDLYMIEEMYRRFLARIMDCDGVLIEDDFIFSLENLERKSKVETQSNDKGEMLADLEIESGYVVNISKKGYFSRRDTTLTTKGFDGELIEREYRLAKIPYDMPVFVDLMYYDLDRAEIREEAKPTLNKLAEMMKSYSFLDLMVRSHTDARASDSYNENLSNRRADAVVDYLKEQGIEKDRISAEWFGEEQLVNDCGDGKPCPEAEHQLNRRSELVLKAFTDQNKQYELPIQFEDDCEDLIEALQRQLSDVGLELPKVYFDYDKANLKAEQKMALERLAIMMKSRNDFQLTLEGHTDLRGSEEYNESLSQRRAKVVLDYLLNRGVSNDRLTYEWFGKNRPVHNCTDCSEAQHQENRRTEIKVKDRIKIQTSENQVNPEKEATAYYIIGGSFKAESSAKAFLAKHQDLEEIGYFYHKEADKYYGYFQKSAEEKSAKAGLRSIREAGFSEAWILAIKG